MSPTWCFVQLYLLNPPPPGPVASRSHKFSLSTFYGHVQQKQLSPILCHVTKNVPALACEHILAASLLQAPRARCEPDHSLPSTAEVKNEWNYNSTPTHAVVAWRGATLPSFTFHRQTAATTDIWPYHVVRTLRLWFSDCDSVKCGRSPLMPLKSLQGPTTSHLPWRRGGGGHVPHKRSWAPNILRDVTTQMVTLCTDWRWKSFHHQFPGNGRTGCNV
jgi:hypothetical protein